MTKKTKTKSGKIGLIVWSSVSVVLVALLTVVTILTSTTFYGIICIALGSERAQFAPGIIPIYEPDYGNKTEVLRAANILNQEVNEEGIILLKNENEALPIATPVSDNRISSRPQISVFGQNSVNLVIGGSGSGAAGTSEYNVNLYQSLSNAGYDVNPTLQNFYENSGFRRSQNSDDLNSGDTVFLSTGEAPQSAYTNTVINSYSEYSDAAIVVFSRIGGEGFDLPRAMTGVAGARNADDHYLQLDANETALLAAVCNGSFKKVIVVINSAAAMELAFLEDPDYYAYQSKIDAALWIGFPGASGAMALGRVLNGEVNPSGKTVDTYVKDLKKDPTWNNFGDNGRADGDRYKYNNADTLYYFVSYEESVYVGYKYYETRAAAYNGPIAALSEDTYANGEQWYDASVVYPFGYGLSYTEFTWTIADKSEIENIAITGSNKYSVEVTVKNTGDKKGRDVVQLYGHAPYEPGGIEKPERVLLDFAKTGELEPDESQSITLEFDPYYLASYDYKDKNDNGFSGYELDNSSNYALYVSKNAHDKALEIPFRVESEIQFKKSTVNDEVTVENRYTDRNVNLNSDTGLSTVLSRNNWTDTWPTTPEGNEYVLSQETYNALRDISHNNPNITHDEEMPLSDEEITITFRDMLTNAAGEYGSVDYDDPRWETLLDQCNLNDLINMYDYGAFTSAGILNIGKPKTNDTDGPAGFTNFISKDGTYWGTCHYAAEVVMAATWNQDLMEEIGKMVGNEGIFGSAGRGNKLPYSGWYAPGVNIHRSAFGGRNFEYFSEDGIMNGKMAAAEIRGCQSKGVYAFVKHFAVNDQETHRSRTGLVTWLTEQSMREIYLKPFELAVKEGKTRAVMSAFNRIGTRWTGGDYRLLTEILRDEWGFKGTVICDFNTVPQYMNSRQMAYAGGDLNLVANDPESWCDTSDAADVIILRQAAKNVFYTVINSNAMNGEIVGYLLPIWQIILIVVDAVVVAGIAVWGFFILRKAYKKSKMN